MKSGSTTPPQRTVRLPILLVGAAVMLVIVVGALRRPAHEDAKPRGESASEPAAAPTERSPDPRPTLPESQPAEARSAEAAEPGPAASRASGFATQATRRKLTQAKVERYVREAYPAWLRAHPGEMCPQQLVELNEYTGDSDAKDAWGHPIKLLCGDHWGGKKHIEVIALGRDAQLGTDDDIRAEQ
jgi:hypothetical protein